MQEEEDCDGSEQYCTLGQVDNINGDGASVFLEVTNEYGAQAGAETTVHEIGHLFFGIHAHDGIMCTSSQQNPCVTFLNFGEESIVQIRAISNP